jgi:hypothetical protein
LTQVSFKQTSPTVLIGGYTPKLSRMEKGWIEHQNLTQYEGVFDMFWSDQSESLSIAYYSEPLSSPMMNSLGIGD